MISQISEEQKVKTAEKFLLWDKVLEKEMLETEPELYWGFLKKDPTLFAYHFFKDENEERIKLFPWQDIFVNDQSRFKLAVNARQVGKTTLEAIDLLHQAYFNPSQTLVCISATKEQVKELIKRVNLLMTGSGFTYWKSLKPRESESSRTVEIKNRGAKTYSRIISVPATDAGRGYSAHKVVLDELAFMENSSYILDQVAIPSTAKTAGSIVGLSTPNGQAGPLWEIYRNPGPWSVYNFDWTSNPYIKPEDIERIRTLPTMTVDKFSAEYEAKFLASQNAFFNQKLVRSAVDEEAGRDSYPSGQLAVGVDFGKHRDFSVIVIGKILETDSDKPSISIAQVIVKPLGTDYAEVMAELKDINDKLHPQIFVLDATGLGDVIFEQLSEAGLPCEPVVLTQPKKLEVLNHLKVLFEQGRIRIPDNSDMINQLCLFEYKYTKQAEDLPSETSKKVGAPVGTHDDIVIATSLMAFGLSGFYAPASVEVIEKPTLLLRKPITNPDHKQLIFCPSCDDYHWDRCPKKDYS